MAEFQVARRALIAGAVATIGSLGSPLRARPTRRTRLGFSTVSIRDRLPFRLPGAPAAPSGRLTILEAPAFAAEVVGLRNLEVWNLQFEDTSPDYCRRLRQAAAKARVDIPNLQVDGRMDLGAPDPAVRAASVAEAREWIDRAALIGSRAIRFNFSALAPKEPFSVGPPAESLRTLAVYGRSKGVLILLENHIGHSIAVENLAAVLRSVNHPNLRTIFDWGNVPDASTERIIATLDVLAPWLHQVSAKGVAFDDDYRMISYDVAAITRATERAGFDGLYSIELFGPVSAAFDPVKGICSMAAVIAKNLI